MTDQESLIIGKVCRCLRCGHKWVSRVREPVRCPACKRVNWRTPPTWKGGTEDDYPET